MKNNILNALFFYQIYSISLKICEIILKKSKQFKKTKGQSIGSVLNDVTKKKLFKPPRMNQKFQIAECFLK